MTKKAAVTGRELVRALGFGLGIALIAGLATGFGLPVIIPLLKDPDWLATVIATEAYLAFIVGHLIVFGGFKGVATRLRLRRPTWSQLGFAFVVWVSIWVIAFALYGIFGPLWEPVREMADAVLKIGGLYGRLEDAGPALFIVAVIQPVIIAPVMEEFIFRGSLFSWLRGKKGAGFAIFLTALIFAFYHPLIWLWPLAFAFGLGAGWVRERTGSVTPFLLMHVLNSIVLITLSYIFTGWHVSF